MRTEDHMSHLQSCRRANACASTSSATWLTTGHKCSRRHVPPTAKRTVNFGDDWGRDAATPFCVLRPIGSVGDSADGAVVAGGGGGIMDGAGTARHALGSRAPVMKGLARHLRQGVALKSATASETMLAIDALSRWTKVAFSSHTSTATSGAVGKLRAMYWIPRARECYIRDDES